MKLTLVNKKHESDDVYSFYFKSSDEFTFRPSQYIYVTLPRLDFEDQRGPTRHFTIANRPSSDFLQITTKIRPESGYKKTLANMQIGEVVEGRGPLGHLDFEKYKGKTNIFFAGGIGITPFRSIIDDLDSKKDDFKIILIYSNSGDNFTFAQELNNWQRDNLGLFVHYHNTKTKERLKKQTIEDIVKKSLSDIKTSQSWIIGPNAFVDAIEDILLNEIFIDQDNIITEKFTGY